MTDQVSQNMVRIDRITLLSSLFKMGKGKPNYSFQQETKFGSETIRARLSSPSTLGAAEQDVLYSLAAIALNFDDSTEFSIRTNYHQILREMRKRSDSVKEYDRIRKSIESLSTVIVTLEREKAGKKYVAFSTKQMIESEGDLDGNITIKFHPVLLAAIRGENYIAIDIGERMRLGETARILHSSLCARVNRGATINIKVRKIIELIFGDEALSARRKNQFNVAAAELVKRGWKISVRSRGDTTQPDDLVAIQRPADRPRPPSRRRLGSRPGLAASPP